MKYLINRSDALGDNILTMPMAEAIKELDPSAKIAFITSKICEDLYKNHPYVDQVFYLNKKESLLKNLKDSFQIFKEFSPDAYYYVGGVQSPTFVAWLKRVPLRGGLLSRLLSFLFLNKGTRQKRSQVAQHEIFYNVDLLRHLDGFEKVDDKEFFPSFNLSNHSSNIADFKKDLTQAGLDAGLPFIIIHPGMTGHTLNWPSHNYGRLVFILNKYYKDKFNFIISYTPSDERFLIGARSEIENHPELKKSVYFLNGALKGLNNYMHILKNARAFVGPSTGTLHIAATLNVPVIGIYSPIKAQSALRWGPRGKNYIQMVAPSVVCGEAVNCSFDDCPYYECMSKIEVDDIIKFLKPVLESEE